MKYIIFEDDQIKKEIIYCVDPDGYSAEPEEIARAMKPFFFMGKFNAKDHEPFNREVVNDDNIFMLANMRDGTFLYQVMGKVADCCGTIVPDLYYIRKIGIIF